jgi:hypothetical protein
MKRSVSMLWTVALMELLLVLAVVMTVLVVTTAATADTAFAQGRPAIGGPPPSTATRNIAADANPSPDNRTEPTTGGHRFDCHGLQGGQC